MHVNEIYAHDNIKYNEWILHFVTDVFEHVNVEVVART